MQITKLYILSDGDGPVRYVGKTVQPLLCRLSSHRSAAKRGKDRRSRWICSARDLRIHLVDEVAGSGSPQERELIASLRALGTPLVNHTDGGEGALGRVWSPEARERIASKLRGRTAAPRSAETRAKLSAALKGRAIPPHVREAQLAAVTGKKTGPLSVEHRSKISVAKTRITKEMMARARECISLGWSQQRAADELGVSQSQLSLRLKGRCR